MNTSVVAKIFLTKFVKTGNFSFDIETAQAFKKTERLIEKDNLANKEGFNG